MVKMKEKILEAFRELGFKLEEEEGMGYCFNYEGLNLLYMYNENDEEFLNIALPGIVEVGGRQNVANMRLVGKNQLHAEVYQGLGDGRD